MQLTLEKSGYKIFFTCKNNLTTVQLTAVLKHLNDTLNEVITGDVPVNDINETVPKIEAKTDPVPAISMKERPAFRDRLPNNLVDVKDLTISQAVTENALVRCPECGQAHAVVVKSGNTMYFMRKDYDKNEFIAIAEVDAYDQHSLLAMCCEEKTNKQDYFTDLQKFKELVNTDFAVNNETEIFCPVCTKSNAFMRWKEAFDAPLNFFETEHLCDACGGEVVEKVAKGKAYTHCENCGLEQSSAAK